jgi:hypothetical protein
MIQSYDHLWLLIQGDYRITVSVTRGGWCENAKD